MGSTLTDTETPYTGKKIKPCLNTQCAWHDIREGLKACNKISTWRNSQHYQEQMEACHLYRSTPLPEPWVPLNPDEYKPGCKDRDLEKEAKCYNCPLNGRDYLTSEAHAYLCETSHCYRPDAKPKTRQIVTLEIDLEKADLDDVLVLDMINNSLAIHNIKNKKSIGACYVEYEGVKSSVRDIEEE